MKKGKVHILAIICLTVGIINLLIIGWFWAILTSVGISQNVHPSPSTLEPQETKLFLLLSSFVFCFLFTVVASVIGIIYNLGRKRWLFWISLGLILLPVLVFCINAYLEAIR